MTERKQLAADELAAKIEEIDRLLGREEHDAGYQAFVKIRKIWPELKRAALSRS